MRLSKAEKERRKSLKELEEMAHKIKKKNWVNYKGTKLYDEEFKQKRKKKNIGDVNKGLKIVDKKLDRIIKENANLKKEVKSLKQDIKTQKEQKLQKVKEQRPLSIIELQRRCGNIIDIEAYKENEKLKERLGKDKKKEKYESNQTNNW